MPVQSLFLSDTYAGDLPMKTLSSLDEVTKYLEQHENSNRIKKLVYSACKGIWENDQNTLDRFKLQELVQELFRLNPTIHKLNDALSKVVKTLNKQAEYTLIARVIYHELKKLYVTNEETTGILVNPPNQQEPIFYHSGQISSNPVDKSPNSQTKYQYNQFDLRQNIMKYTNPLRAKILIFSALDNNFTFNEEDWLKLRAEKLDDLLRKLFDTCPTIKELESKLNSTVISLDNLDENTQAASAIIQSMRSLYADMLSNANKYQPFNSDSSQKSLTIVNPNAQTALKSDDNSNNTCQFIIPPTKDAF
ncbi:hypothetical protein H6G32_24945 [Cylindrospermum sp. FACHB-282]|nr:hypothetical protein [Cylindrospermum sp. FACHB-282]